MQSKEWDKVDTLLAKQSTKKLSARAASVNPKEKLKVLWVVAKPLLEAVKGLLFFKPKWQNTIGDLIVGIDAMLAS